MSAQPVVTRSQVLAEIEYRRRQAEVHKASKRRWIVFEPSDESDRFHFTLDFGAASPLPDLDTEEDSDYYEGIVAWSFQRETETHRRVAQRPRFYAYEAPRLYDKQHEAIYDTARWVYIEASTKAGKTAGNMAWLLDQALRGLPGMNYWWVAPTYAQARMVFRRFERGLPPQVYLANRSELTLTFPNGAVMWFKSGDRPDSLYGEDVGAVVGDEASRMGDLVRDAIRSVLTATKGLARWIGNVRGRKNWFYQASRKAEAGEPNSAYFKITCWDAVEAGVLDREEIEDARRSLPPKVFAELYEAEASDDGGNPFGIASIRACVAELSSKPPLVWGWDLAKSTDWTVGLALDEEGATCRLQRFQKPWLETTDTIKIFTGEDPALVDSTGVGDPIVEMLQADGGENFEGYNFSSKSKQQLMEGLAVAIQTREIRFPDGWLVNELEAFEYQYTKTGVRYSAPEGMHDDGVMALALAVRRKSQPVDSWGDVW